MFKDKINPNEEETHQEYDFVKLDDLSEVMIPERNESGSSTSILNPGSYESDEESGSSTSTSIIPLSNLELNTPTAAIRRTTRITRPPKHHCCYVKKFENSYVILLLYVDDMLIAGANIVEINKLKKLMSEYFEMKDLGAAKQILGMRIARDRIKGTLTLSQAEYIKRILSRFSMDNAKPVGTPLGNHFKLSKNQSPKSEEERYYMNKVPYASAVGSLMYAMICTRPDISHAVGVVSRYMSNPRKQHWEAVKWILRYLKGSTETCLCFSGKDLVVQGYVDADLARDIDSRKSTTGFIYTYGGTAVSWGSNLQKTVSLSTTEAEYIAVSEVAKEMIWLQNFLEELGKERQSGTLYSDSQSAIFLAKNPAYHSRTKHISIKYHFIRSLLDDKQLLLEKICGRNNPADMLTKSVTLDKLKLCATSVGLSA
ncbi:hypothetical protein SADUNF_Sadunf11G0066100 [Salix dunnii]|uniref:Reverse transcriptase Ty1/copia-type domain-containing protein n=1 Tax=Salix dunnii TaxID=1413687 RepID=A0A835JQG2_9ROSI|nr:hypothetical protein SADUNF_Sadunf11G0066100 [Salix dunnii]